MFAATLAALRRRAPAAAMAATRGSTSSNRLLTSRTGRPGAGRLIPGGRAAFAPLAAVRASAPGATAAASSSAAPPPPAPTPLPKLKDSFLTGNSNVYLEELEERYRADPASVDQSWAAFFRALEQGTPPEAIAEAYHAYESGESAVAPLTAAALSAQTIHESMKLLLLVRAYQVAGHFMADLDPLGLDPRPAPSELDPATYGFTEADLDREFYLGSWRMAGFMSEERPVRTLREVLGRLRDAYCGKIGFEYMHIPDRDRCNWLRERIETPETFAYPPERRVHMLDRLAWSEMFESFLAAKYSAAKRFGLEGGETLIPGMKAMIDRAAELGVESIVLGMPHRGRLNVLANVVRKPMAQIFSEFTGVRPGEGDGYSGTGDVKYHLGTSYDRPTVCGRRVHLSLLANPSHLEAVDPVLLGKVRAKQFYDGDADGARTMGVLLHGDGSFAGQGVVYETLDMSGLPDYATGGTIHIIVNNQVAFTTDPRFSRSSPYCTDVAKALNAPIFHVNGDDVEAVVRVCELAAEWRAAWKSDVVVDIVCYRRHGHNEIDEPMFTQPLMYKKIKAHTDPYRLYQDRLLGEGVVSKEEVKAISNKVAAHMADEFEHARDYQPAAKDWLSSYWAGFHGPNQLSRIRDTGVPGAVLREVGKAVSTLPPWLHPHRQIAKVYEARAAAVESGAGVDWALGEALAFGTLLAEGNHVRLSGQDVERGTFSHRHAVLHDQETGARYTPLAHVYAGQAPGQFTVSNSSLSEFGVLGFELGYALENPNALVLWEAQFGDFANGAQVIFDQFMSSGEAKWLRQNGLTVLLPHGYDGQGPEHSSARLERFLQMSDENPYVLPAVDASQWAVGGHLGAQIQSANWQVANVTTPANYFHLLRRQLHRQFRKPLVVMAPKNLLRHPAARSDLSEFDDATDDPHIQGVRFKRLIMDASAADRSPHPPPVPGVRRLVLCSGKVYYELAAARDKAGLGADGAGGVAIVRLEQLVPFPFDLVMRELRRYPDAEVMWVQEEPMNQGAYTHVAPRLKTCMQAEERSVPHQIPYAGRGPSAATATGFAEVHAREQAQLVADALAP